LINIPETTSSGSPEPIRADRHGPCEDDIVKGRNVPKRDNPAGLDASMLGRGRPEQTMDDGVFADAKPAGVALVPQVSSAQWAQVPRELLWRCDPTFVTPLIATAEHLPQTRSLRRATPSDAQTAYGAQGHPVYGVGIRTRRII
jgi:hypothetical protein